MKRYWPLAVVFAIIVALLYLLIPKFPVSYRVCTLGYQDCQVVAKFKDRDGCETTKEYWNWLCDKTDKNNITCHESDNSIAIGYCE